MSTPEIPALYRATRERVAAFVRTLTPDAHHTVVPACPEWTVHDVVAHVVGITDDALAGNMDGVTTDPWTAAQVARGRDVPVAELLDRWERNAAAFEPRTAAAPLSVVDLVSHEHDLYGAFGVQAARDSDALAFACSVVGVDGFEAFRARLGRRSAAQLVAMGIDPASTVFGPSAHDLVE